MARDLLPKWAGDLQGPSVMEVLELASRANTDIAFGMPPRDEETRVLYNSSAHVSSSGEVVSYQKLYPANFGPS